MAILLDPGQDPERNHSSHPRAGGAVPITCPDCGARVGFVGHFKHPGGTCDECHAQRQRFAAWKMREFGPRVGQVGHDGPPTLPPLPPRDDSSGPAGSGSPIQP